MEPVGLEHSSGTSHKLCKLHHQPTIPTLTDVRETKIPVFTYSPILHMKGEGRCPVEVSLSSVSICGMCIGQLCVNPMRGKSPFLVSLILSWFRKRERERVSENSCPIEEKIKR